MPELSLENWWQGIHPGYYETPYNPDSPGNQGGGSGGSPSPLFNIHLPENTVAPGIPAYNGWQEPDYSARTPMPDHWLNTMNAFAPTARSDMSRLLGQGGGSAGGMGASQPAYSPPQLRPEQMLTPSQYPFKGQAPGYMDAFYNTPYSAYSQPTQQGQPYTNSTGLLGGPTQKQPEQQPQFQGQAPGLMDAFYQQPSGYQGSPTIGIDPATGRYTFAGNTQ